MNHILIIRMSALGDVAMSIPVIYSLAAANPDTHFTLLTQNIASKLVINPPSNVSVYKADIKGKHKGLGGLFKLFCELKKLKIDSVADLHDVLRSKVIRSLFFLTGTKTVKIDKGRKEKKRLVAQTNKHKIQLEKTTDRYFDVFKKLGVPKNESFTSIFGVGKKGDTSLFQNITPSKKNNEIWIGIAPFAKHKGKIYPEDKMELLIKHYSETGLHKIFLLGGGRTEESILNDWVEKYPNTISMAGKHGFLKELSLISHFDAMISMDSANMHLASLVNIPVVSVWGATHVYAGFLGWKQDLKNIADIELSCRPCSVFGNKPCFRANYACLEGISPQLIINKTDLLINQKNIAPFS